MEKIDPGTNTITIGPTLYDNTATSNNGVPDIKTIHHTYVSPLHAFKFIKSDIFLIKQCELFCNNVRANIN